MNAIQEPQNLWERINLLSITDSILVINQFNSERYILIQNVIQVTMQLLNCGLITLSERQIFKCE